MDTKDDTSAIPSAGPDPELIETMRALATSIQMIQVGQQRTTHCLQVVGEQGKKTATTWMS
jgi:hypothetical protein